MLTDPELLNNPREFPSSIPPLVASDEDPHDQTGHQGRNHYTARTRSHQLRHEPNDAPTDASYETCQMDPVGTNMGQVPELVVSQCDTHPVALDTERTVTLYFIRHAQSQWNELSLAGKITNPPQAFLQDAKLSKEGLRGAQKLRDWISERPCKSKDQCFLAGLPVEGEPRKAVFATSNLRRAALTALIGFHDRLSTIPTEIHVVSALQELGSENGSTTLSVPGGPPALSLSDDKCPLRKVDLRFNTEWNLPDERSKRLGGDYVVSFCNWMRRMVSVDPQATDFVVVGHSVWFSRFVETFLADTRLTPLEHDLMYFSIPNQGVVRMSITMGTERSCQIVSGTSQLIFGQMH